MSGKLIIQGKAWGEFESAKRSKGNIEISGYRSYGGTHTVRMVDQPQLNENQKALVIWMQENECYNGDPLESISDLFLEGTPSEHFPDLPLSCVEAAYQSLNNQQKIEMVQKYLEQYLEQGEE